MRTFKDRNHVSNVPKNWQAPNGRRIEWRSDRQTYDDFYQSILAYYHANNLSPVPDSATVEDHICGQLPRWSCVQEGYHTVSQSSPVVGTVRTGCKSCGRG